MCLKTITELLHHHASWGGSFKQTPTLCWRQRHLNITPTEKKTNPNPNTASTTHQQQPRVHSCCNAMGPREEGCPGTGAQQSPSWHPRVYSPSANSRDNRGGCVTRCSWIPPTLLIKQHCWLPTLLFPILEVWNFLLLSARRTRPQILFFPSSKTEVQAVHFHWISHRWIKIVERFAQLLLRQHLLLLPVNASVSMQKSCKQTEKYHPALRDKQLWAVQANQAAEHLAAGFAL